MTGTAQKQVLDLIKRSKKVLILPSSPPDGDSLGSAVALYMVLKKLDKEVTVVCKDSIPEVFHFLPNAKVIGDKMLASNDFVITIDTRKAKIDRVKSETEGDKVNIVIIPKEGNFSEEDISFNKGKIDYDLIITVDCAELTQLGELYENNVELFHQIPVINIDHHISNTHFGKVNYVDIMASSTTELLLPVIEEMAKEEGKDLIDEDVATLLLTGIITDTGSFQNANTTPRSFASSAELIAYGARQQEIIQHIYKTKQLTQLKLWGRILSKIQVDKDNRMVWSTVSQQDFKDTESHEDQIGDVIDELMTNAPGAEIIILIKERADGEISVSMRTTTPALDASAIAETFGGGGHARASGFRIKDMSLRDAEYKIIEEVKRLQKSRTVAEQSEAEVQSEQKAEETPKEQPKEKAEPKPATPKPESSKINIAEIIDKAEPKPQKSQPKKKTRKTTKKSKKFSPKPPSEESEQGTEVVYKFED